MEKLGQNTGMRAAAVAPETGDAGARDGSTPTSEADSLAPAVTRAATILDVLA